MKTLREVFTHVTANPEQPVDAAARELRVKHEVVAWAHLRLDAPSYRRDFKRRTDGEWIAWYMRQAERGSAKSASHILLAVAIQRGMLVRQEVCEACGNRSHYTLRGHHHDYSAPLDVTWLCYSCHGLEHAGRLGTPLAGRGRHYMHEGQAVCYRPDITPAGRAALETP